MALKTVAASACKTACCRCLGAGYDAWDGGASDGGSQGDISAPAERAQLDDWDQLIQAGAQGGSRGALVQAGAEAMSYEELCQAHIDAMLQVEPPRLHASWHASSLCVASGTPAGRVVLWGCSCARLQIIKA